MTSTIEVKPIDVITKAPVTTAIITLHPNSIANPTIRNASLQGTSSVIFEGLQKDFYWMTIKAKGYIPTTASINLFDFTNEVVIVSLRTSDAVGVIAEALPPNTQFSKINRILKGGEISIRFNTSPQGARVQIGSLTSITSPATWGGLVGDQNITITLSGYITVKFNTSAFPKSIAWNILIPLQLKEETPFTPKPEEPALPSPEPISPSPLPEGAERVDCKDPTTDGTLPDGTCFRTIKEGQPPPEPVPKSPASVLTPEDLEALEELDKLPPGSFIERRPLSPQFTLPFWKEKGYTESQAIAILDWMEKNQQSPGDDEIRKVINEEYVNISDDDRNALDLLASLDETERTELIDSGDFNTEEVNWLKRFFVGNWAGEDTISNTVPFGIVGGAGILTAIGSVKKLAVFRTGLGKIKGFMKWGINAPKRINPKTGKLVGSVLTKGGIARVLGGKLAKTAGAIAGVDGMMVWLAEDNVLSGAGFTLRKLRDSIKFGVITREETSEIINKVQKWIDTAESLVRISTKLNPFLFPFKEILLTNVEKSKADFELEVGLINAEWGKQTGEPDRKQQLRNKIRKIRNDKKNRLNKEKKEDLGRKEERIDIDNEIKREIETKKEEIEAGGDKDKIKLEIDELQDEVRERGLVYKEEDVERDIASQKIKKIEDDKIIILTKEVMK